MKICLINCSNPTTELLGHESDSYVDYRMGRASCFDGSKCLKHCRSWHSWPYALETEFFVYLKDKWQEIYKYDAVIVLVNREIDKVMPLVKKLKAMKKKVAISFHESVSDFFGGSGFSNEDLPKRWIGLAELVKEADFYINLFEQARPVFSGWFGQEKVKYCSHAVPLDWRHGFEIPFEKRGKDILIGTRTFNQRIARNTLATLCVLNGLSKQHGWNIHYLSEDGDVTPLLGKMGLMNIKTHTGPLKWEDWLKFVADTKVVVQSDSSINLGQISMDCAMVDTRCFGGTTWNAILTGNDDGGDFRKWENELVDLLLNNKRLSCETFKKSINPDFVKSDLINLFK